MSRASRVTAATVAVAFLLVSALPLVACTPTKPPSRPAAPKVAPPAIKVDGVLRAGTDLSYPPFAGVDQGQKAGIDIDVASALAGRLGLDVQFIDVKAPGIANALARGDADVVLSAPFSADVLNRGTIAGTYISDGPALFTRGPGASADSTASVVGRESIAIGAQSGSEAYWDLVAERGADQVTAYPTLREAFNALAAGEVKYVGADALVGAYIARDQSPTRYVGALAPAHLLGVAVSADNPKLADKVRSALDSMAADGVLDTIRSAWVGGLPKLPLQTGGSPSASPSESTTP